MSSIAHEQPEPGDFDGIIARSYEPAMLSRGKMLGMYAFNVIYLPPEVRQLVPEVSPEIGAVLLRHQFRPASSARGLDRLAQN